MASSSSVPSDSDILAFPVDKVKKWPRTPKTYNPKWEKDAVLKTWINRHPSDVGKVVCRYCQSLIRAHKNDLLEHTRTLKHLRNFAQNSSTEIYSQLIHDLNNDYRKDPATGKRRSVLQIASTADLQPQNVTQGAANLLPENTQGASDNAVNSVTCTYGTAYLSLNDSSDSGTSCDTAIEVLANHEDSWNQETENEEYNVSTEESPSDLVSVILEEQQSPTSTTNFTASPGTSANILTMESADSISGLQALNGMVLTGISGFENVNFTLLNGATLTSPQLVTTTSNLLTDGTQTNIPVVSVTTEDNSSESVTSSFVINAKSEMLRPFNIKDIITAVDEDMFSFSELCQLAKAALNRIENGDKMMKQAIINSGQIQTQTIPVSISISSSDGIMTESQLQEAICKKDRPIKKLKFDTSTFICN